MNDIAILQAMLTSGAQLPLKQTTGITSVTLKDKQAKTSVEITEIPQDSIVIRAEVFKPPNILTARNRSTQTCGFCHSF